MLAQKNSRSHLLGPDRSHLFIRGEFTAGGGGFRRPQWCRICPFSRPKEIAVAQLVLTHLKGMLDFDAGEKRPQTARDAVIMKGPQAR